VPVVNNQKEIITFRNQIKSFERQFPRSYCWCIQHILMSSSSSSSSSSLWSRIFRFLFFSLAMILAVVFILRSQRESQQKLKASLATDRLYDSLTDVLFPACHGIECFIESNNRPRRDQYCSKTVFPGSEGEHFHLHEHYELQNLVITIRHGDRSSMHSLPNAKLMKFPTASLLKPEVLQFVSYLSQFSLKYIVDTPATTSDKKLKRKIQEEKATDGSNVGDNIERSGDTSVETNTSKVIPLL